MRLSQPLLDHSLNLCCDIRLLQGGPDHHRDCSDVSDLALGQPRRCGRHRRSQLRQHGATILCVRDDSSRFVSADPVLGDSLLEERRSARFGNSLASAGGGWPYRRVRNPLYSGERSAGSRNRPHGKSPRVCAPDGRKHDLHDPPDFAR